MILGAKLAQEAAVQVAQASFQIAPAGQPGWRAVTLEINRSIDLYEVFFNYG
jgi:hypothetical protein